MEDITPMEDDAKHAGVTRAFARHILYGEPMIADGREGLASLSLANAMLLSSWTGETISLPMNEANDARYAQMLEARAASSRKRAFRPIEMDLGKSF